MHLLSKAAEMSPIEMLEVIPPIEVKKRAMRMEDFHQVEISLSGRSSREKVVESSSLSERGKSSSGE